MPRMIKILVILLVVSTLSSTAQAKLKQLTVIPENQLVWKSLANLPPGAKIAHVFGDPEKRELFVARVSLPAHYHVSINSHTADEVDTILSGTYYIQLGDSITGKVFKLPAGTSIILPADLVHTGWTNTKTVIQIAGIGPSGILYRPVK